MERSYDDWTQLLRALNVALRDGALDPVGLAEALRAMGYVVEQCVIFEMSPVDKVTWIVRLLDRLGRGSEARVDLSDPSKSTRSNLKEAYVLGRRSQLMLRAARDLHAELSDSSPYKKRKPRRDQKNMH